ncbi:hypothetical protein HPB47_019389 [Ixodes persulcatus]|uniref:Uncharacterized protein n=1 Tax=Ixodes persulcatus TaxID=34615 RepID=A0AC60QIC5_IXOPE|nr:hypothetical protein HPB47_019389 [Ixodes persulcatus]
MVAESDETVEYTRLVISKVQGWLCCNPDGLVQAGDDYILLEIKCPYRCRDKPICDKEGNLSVDYLHFGWPYRVEDFRDAVICLASLSEISAVGAYQINHVWAGSNVQERRRQNKVLETPEATVKGRRCIVIDPGHQKVRVKLHWLLFSVTDGDVREAQNAGTMTRTAVLWLKAGVTCDDIPHQLRVGGELALVVVPGRAPLCLRCQQTGYIRKECRVPRCNVCRRFGHEGAHCVRTYAAAAVPVGGLEKSELLMDKDDAEEAAAGSTVKRSPVANTLPAAEDVAGTSTNDASPNAGETVHAGQHGDGGGGGAYTVRCGGRRLRCSQEAAAVDVPMDDAEKTEGCYTVKRTREENVAGPKDSEQKEPPS